MNRSMILFASISAFIPRLALAADKGGGAGDAAPKTLEQRLTDATTEAAALRDQVATLTKERDDAKAESTRVQTQFDELSKTAKDAQDKITKIETELTDTKAKLTTTESTLATANTNVSRLETLCKLKGIPADQSVPMVPKGEDKLSVSDWEAKMKEAKTPTDQAKVAKDFEAAVAAGNVL